MKKILRDKSGVSLIFVLAAMLLLMAIGVSAITAAGLNMGAGIAQRDRNQLDLYASSMERTVKASLEKKEPDGTSIPNVQTLTGRIIRAAYENGSGLYDLTGANALELTASSPDGGAKYKIVISGNFKVHIIPPVEYTEWIESTVVDEEGNSVLVYEEKTTGRSPQTATIDGKITAVQTTEYSTLGGRDLSVTTATSYQFGGALIEEDFSTYTSPVLDDNMIITGLGTWTVTGHA